MTGEGIVIMSLHVLPDYGTILMDCPPAPESVPPRRLRAYVLMAAI